MHKRGVGEHPHRGFETVTFAYQGEIEHRDSNGGGGKIGPGDVQWMTAGAGVVHEEKHSQDFAKRGGTFEMVQLWVNLPAKLKMTAPRYQSLIGTSFPKITLGAAELRLIAGEAADARGPAKTHSAVQVFDLSFYEDGESSLEFPPELTALLFVLQGDVDIQDGTRAASRDLVVLERGKGSKTKLRAKKGTRLLALAGEPLGEPVVAQGPFVMNTGEQIRQAMWDYQSGAMGRLD